MEPAEKSRLSFLIERQINRETERKREEGRKRKRESAQNTKMRKAKSSGHAIGMFYFSPVFSARFMLANVCLAKSIFTPRGREITFG